jgi:predicted nucleic acid-binding protein
MGRSRKGLLIMDANVLIDLCEADRTVIRLISEHIGQVHVPLPVLREEVDEIDEAEYADLGIVPVEPPLQTAADAATRRAGLSFHDHLCLLLARDNGWTCVTNDGRLRRECTAESVPVLWGLETVALLVEDSVLTAKAAEEIGRAIQRANPHFITEEVIARFLARIGLAPKKSPRRKPPKKAK